MVIKLIPLGLIAVVGLVSGLLNGVVVENLSVAATTVTSNVGSLATAVVACAFAYEGWIVAVSINEELIDAKKNLPKALVIGTIIVFVVYVLYFLGMNSVLSSEVIMAEGDGAVTTAAATLFSSAVGSLINVFVVISCLGTTNGLVLASTRTPYSLAKRNHGPLPKLLSEVNDKTGMPVNSALFALGLTALYLGVWYGNFAGAFGSLFIDISELPIVLIYVLYSTLYVTAMIKLTDLTVVKRFVIPTLAVLGSLVVVYGGLVNPNISYYMVISVAIILVGLFFYRPLNVEMESDLKPSEA
jgi:APA family basic amino acid/polyamine antiporter